MAEQDLSLKELAEQLKSLAKDYRSAERINGVDNAGKAMQPALTAEQVADAAAAYETAARWMGRSCQQLVLGIRITS